MGSMSISVAKMALVVLGLAACVVYASNALTMPVIVGIALLGVLGLVNVPMPKDASRIPRAVSLITAFVIAAFGLIIAWATHPHREDHASRVLDDFGWADRGRRWVAGVFDHRRVLGEARDDAIRRRRARAMARG